VPTTVHVPADLLERVDTRAKALGVSRNRFIVKALEESLGVRDAWPAELVRMLKRPIAARASSDLEDSLTVVRRRRASRRQPPTV
jgi:hypothetical protein